MNRGHNPSFRANQAQEPEPSERVKAATLRYSERFLEAVRRYGYKDDGGADGLGEAIEMAISMEGLRIFDPANPADTFVALTYGFRL